MRRLLSSISLSLSAATNCLVWGFHTPFISSSSSSSSSSLLSVSLLGRFVRPLVQATAQQQRSLHSATSILKSASILKANRNPFLLRQTLTDVDTFNYIRVDLRTMANFINKEVAPTEGQPLLLPYSEDRYDGVIINSLPSNDAQFEEMLTYSMGYWKEIKRRGIWLKLPIERASFVPIAAKQGFVFHHAERDYVMMTNWLADGESRLPPNASHQVGVGCVVIHDGKLLLVQEKNGPLKGSGVWKVPTGLAEVGEDIGQAAEREVFEETGIRAKFEKLLAFRQAHNVLFGKSDLFFLCVLSPLTTDIQAQEVEIHACEWKEPEALLEQPFFKRSPLHTVLNGKIRNEIATHKGGATPQPFLTSKKLALGFRPGESSLFYYDNEWNIIQDTNTSTEDPQQKN